MRLSAAVRAPGSRQRAQYVRERPVRFIKLDLTKLGAKFLGDDSGATAIEYAIIAGMLSIVILTAVTSVGTSVNATFTSVQAGVK